MTYREFILSATERLSAIYPQAEARAIAVELFTAKLNVPEYKYLSEPGTVVPAKGLEELEQAMQQLEEERPLQYVLGYTMFAGLRIKVKEGCLIPRPETEYMFSLAGADLDELIARAEAGRGFNVLDICTGSGALAYAFAAEFPEVQTYGCDLSEEALKIACRQRVKIDGARPVFFSADVLKDAPAGLPQFDFIVSNPPYVCESERELMRGNVLRFEPEMALFVPDEDPLRFYRAIAGWTEQMLVSGGHLWLEINENFGPQTAALFAGSEIIKDLNGKDRYVKYIKK